MMIYTNKILFKRYCRTIAMELISLESAEEAQQLADYLRPGEFTKTLKLEKEIDVICRVTF